MPSVPGLHGNVVRFVQLALEPLLPPSLPPLLLAVPLLLLVPLPLLLPPPLLLPSAGPPWPDEQPIPPGTKRAPPAMASTPPRVFQPTGFMGTTSLID